MLKTVLYPGRLALRLAAYIILFSSIVTLAMTAAELLRAYRQDLRQIDERMQQIESAYVDSAVENLWVMDKERLETQLHGITRLPDIVTAEIRVDGKPLLSQGQPLSGADMTRSFVLQRMHRGQQQAIGELVVSASFANAEQRTLDLLFVLLLTNGITILLIAIFMLFIFYRLIGRHLEQVARFSLEQAHSPDTSPLSLQRQEPGKADELTVLTRAINTMRKRLLDLSEAESQRANELQTLLLQQRLFGQMFAYSSEAIMITDQDNRIVEINPAFTRLTGYVIDEVRGANPRILASGRTPPETYQTLWAALQSSGQWQGELWDRSKHGAVYPKWTSISTIRDENGTVTHYIASFTDISERKAAEERISYLAHHDVLTGLPNRFSLEGRLDQAILSARRDNKQLAVMFIDLDRFKTINDTLGHHVGDHLLSEVAKRLRNCVRESDIVARLGGDEFVIVLTGIRAIADVAMMSSKVLHQLTETYQIDGHDLHSSSSVGISVYPDNGGSAEALMKAADTAMYHAKDKGRNNAQFFTDAMNADAHERLLLERELRVALKECQFELHYQPQVCTHSKVVCGVEALVRWRHPERGLIPPLKFIPIAEEVGLIEELGCWVLDEACRQHAVLRSQGVEGIRMAVNLSAHQLRSSSLVDFVRSAMARHGLSHGDLELEVTESAAMENSAQAITHLEALRDLGVNLAIDDFGTGYSSLAYLKLLPIQTLKLDRSFVKDIETDENDAAISAATIALAHSLGLKVVAEGVETDGQSSFLEEHGCDFLQGYFYGRPEPAERLADVIRSVARV